MFFDTAKIDAGDYFETFCMAGLDDTKIWLWEALSAGGRFWNCNFTGQHPAATLDRRNAFVSKDAYSFVKNNEKVLTRQTPVYDALIFYSKPTRIKFANRRKEDDYFGTPVRGVEEVLRENHIQYGFLPDEGFSNDKLKDLKLLILPNVACISDEHSAVIKKYVAEGGCLIATYETSLYDENGDQRKDFSLSELFGCTYSGKANTVYDCYQRIVNRHKILSGFENTDLLINAGETILCNPPGKSSTSVLATYIPIIPNQPPEKAWTPVMQTDSPTITVNRYGKGTVVYFATQTGRLSFIGAHEDFRYTMRNAINYLLDGSAALTTNAPESVHINLTKNIDGTNNTYILSLVNHTSSPTRPIRSLVPVNNIKVKLNLPGYNLYSHKVLRSEGNVDINGTSEIDIDIETLKEYCSISFELYK